MWVITIIAGLYFAVNTIEPLYDRYVNNPIIRTIKTTNFPIEKIDFPAVTICSNNKVGIDIDIDILKLNQINHLFLYISDNAITAQFYC